MMEYIALMTLGIGTYFDVFNKKMVPDIIWTIGATVGLVLIITTGSTSFFSLAKIAEIGVIFIVTHYIAKLGIWGGADSKAWIMMTVLLPFGGSTMALSNAFLIAFLTMPFYLIVSGIKFKDWSRFPMPFILFMYLGTLSYVLLGWITFGT
jgi:hypothetical protein